MRDFYVYLVYRKEAIYVGKGRLYRYSESLREQRGDRVRLVAQNLEEAEAFRLEDYLYCHLLRRGFTLLNKRRPGRYGVPDEASGSYHSEETRELMRQNWQDPVIRQKRIDAQRGNQKALGNRHTAEFRAHMSAIHAGNQHAAGRKHSEETRRLMSERQRERWRLRRIASQS
jgi:hypothetical protein